jgi:imidazole glycerol-phosphate synthase subunit HisF
MLKSRLIFTLLLDAGYYNLSRNFRLQRVGDLKWVQENYDFDSIARSIDELVVLDVAKAEASDIDALAAQVRRLSGQCFMPIAAGGGIRSIAHAQKLFQAGADKLVLNSPYFEDPRLVRELVRTYGAQSIVASIDFRLQEDGTRRVYCRGGTLDTGLKLEQAIALVQEVGTGELYLTSMERDGTGDGYDLESLSMASQLASVPVIASGGAGNYAHFVEALRSRAVNAVSTANLFNFMGDGLRDARNEMLQDGVSLALWMPF